MMIAKNKNILCLECKGSIEYCFCYCPYCGSITENCRCKIEDLKCSDKILSTTHDSKFGILNKLKKSSAMNNKDDDWWRLEKWQIGRRKFP